MSAVFDLTVQGINELKAALKTLNETSKAQLDLMAATDQVTRGLRAEAQVGFAALTKAMKENSSSVRENIKAKEAQISSVGQLTKALSQEVVKISEVKAALQASNAVSEKNLQVVTRLGTAASGTSVTLRNLAIATEANSRANAQAISGYSRIATLIGERKNLESGLTAAIARRSAAEEASLAIARQKHALDQQAIRDIQLRKVLTSSLDRDGSTAVLRELGYLTDGVAAKTRNAHAATAKWTALHRDLHSVLRGVGAASGSLFLTYGSILPMITAFGAAATGISSIKVGAQFESQVKYIEQLQESSAGVVFSFDEIKSKLLEIKGVGQTPAELAEGVKELVKAGISAQDALSGIGDMAKFVTVTETDMAKASDLVASQWLAWGPSSQAASRGVQSMSELLNLLSFTIVKSKADMDSMKTSMAYVTSLSGASDASYTDLLALAGALHNVGIESSMAGTTIRNALMKLQRESVIEKLTEQFNKFKVAYDPFTDASQTHYKQGIAALYEFKAAADKLPPTVRASVTEMAFGVRGMNVAGLDFKATMDAVGNAVTTNTSGKAPDVFKLKKELEDLQKAIRANDLEKNFLGTVFEGISTTALFKFAEIKAGIQRNMAEAFDSKAVSDALDNMIEAVDGDAFKSLIEGISNSATTLLKIFGEIANSPITAVLSGAVTGLSNFITIISNPVIGSIAAAGGIFALLFFGGPASAGAAVIALAANAIGIGFEMGGMLALMSDGVLSFSDAINMSGSDRSKLIADIRETGAASEASAASLRKLQIATANDEFATLVRKRERAQKAYDENKDSPIGSLFNGKNQQVITETTAEMSAIGLRLNTLKAEEKAAQERTTKTAADKVAREKELKAKQEEMRKFQAQMEAAAKGVPVGASGDLSKQEIDAAKRTQSEKLSMEKELRDYKTEMMADGLDKELTKVHNSYADAKAKFDQMKGNYSKTDQDAMAQQLTSNYYKGLETAEAEYTAKKKTRDEAEARRKNKILEDEAQANEKMYNFLATKGIASAETLYNFRKKAIANDVAEMKRSSNDKALIAAYEAEQLKQAWKESLASSNNFLDGFSSALMDAEEKMADFGSLGKQVFADLQKGISGMYKSILEGDFDSIGDGLKAMGENLKDTIFNFVADSMATKTISVGKDLLTSLFPSLGGMFGSSGPTYSNGAMNVNVVNGAGGLAGIAGSLTGEGGVLGGIKSWITENLGEGVTSVLGKVVGAVGLAGGAYGMYSGYKDLKEGKTGSGAVKMGMGAVSAYKGATSLGVVTEGTATNIAKAALAKIGVGGAAKIAGTKIATTYIAGKGATSYATFQAAASGSQAAAGATAAGGSTAASSGAGMSVGALGAVLAPVIVGITKRLTRVRYDTSNEMNKAGISPGNLEASGFTNAFKDVKGTILDAIPGLRAYQQAAYDASSASMLLTGQTQMAAVQFDQATGKWNAANINAAGSYQQVTQMNTAVTGTMVQNMKVRMEAERGVSVSMLEAARATNALAMAASTAANSENGAASTAVSFAAELDALRGTASSAGGAVSGLSSGLSTVAGQGRAADGSLDLVAAGITQTAVVARNGAGAFGGLMSSMQGLSSAAASAAGGVSSAASKILNASRTSYGANYSNNNRLGGRINYATGGILQGGSGYKDDLYLGTVNGVQQVAMGGEYIMPQGATQKYLPLLEKMRRKEYAVGGRVSASDDTLAEFMDYVGYETRKLSMSDLAISIEDLTREFVDYTAHAQELGANGTQLGQLTSLRDKLIAKEQADKAKELSDYMSDILVDMEEFTLTETQRDIAQNTRDLQESIAAAKELGATETDLGKIRELYGKKLDQINNEGIKEAVNGLSEFVKSMSGVEDATLSSKAAQQKLFETLAMAKNGDFSLVSQISDVLKDISIDKKNYATAADYARDYWRTSTAASELEKLSGSKLGMPGYASGGVHVGGWRVVGEDGPEVEYTGPSTIYNRGQLVDLSEVVRELKQLRREMSAGNYAVAKFSMKSAKALEAMQVDGIYLDAGEL